MVNKVVVNSLEDTLGKKTARQLDLKRPTGRGKQISSLSLCLGGKLPTQKAVAARL